MISVMLMYSVSHMIKSSFVNDDVVTKDLYCFIWDCIWWPLAEIMAVVGCVDKILIFCNVSPYKFCHFKQIFITVG